MKETKQAKLSLDQLEELLTFKYLENSYKIFWMKAIIREVEKGNKEVSFLELALNMVVDAWELVVGKGITFGRHDKMYRIIEELRTTWSIDDDITREDLLETLRYLPDIEEIVEDLYEDTPYRLYEPVYQRKLKGKKDSAKNQILLEAINEDTGALYRITEVHTVIINETWIRYIKGNIKKVNGWLHDRLSYFLDEKAMKR